METIVKTKQDIDIFNIVKNHLINQGDKCVEMTGGDCQYYGLTDCNVNVILDNINEDYEGDFDYLRELIENERLKRNMPTAHCAVGVLIKPEFYDDCLEGTLIDSNSLVKMAVQNSHPDWEIKDQSMDMMKTLQCVHDNINPDIWNKALDSLSVFFDQNGIWTGDLKDTSSEQTSVILNNYKVNY